MYTEFVVVVGIVAVNLQFVCSRCKPCSRARAADRGSRAGLGAGRLRTFRHVILPLAMPGVNAATILSFILAMNAYATPVLLGGPTFHMMGPTVYNQFAGLTNWAVRRCAGVRADDGDATADGYVQLGCAAAVPNLIRRRGADSVGQFPTSMPVGQSKTM